MVTRNMGFTGRVPCVGGSARGQARLEGPMASTQDAQRAASTPPRIDTANRRRG